MSFWAEPIRMPWGKTAKYVTAGLALVLAAIVVARAQPYPSRPITMVVPFGAGGPSDSIGRIVAEGMREPLGQPLIVENVAGASGTIGVGRVAGASPDGYTIVFGNWATHVLNGVMFSLRYDLIEDFAPIALVSSDPLLIVARKTIPARDLQDARYRHQAQFRHGRWLGRCKPTATARQHWPGDFSAGSADTRSARRLSARRDREMVADHQGSWHQS